jgi:hypothetical protein
MKARRGFWKDLRVGGRENLRDVARSMVHYRWKQDRPRSHLLVLALAVPASAACMIRIKIFNYPLQLCNEANKYIVTK